MKIVEDLETISSICPILYKKLHSIQNKNSKGFDISKTIQNANTEEIHLMDIRKNDVENTKQSIIDNTPKVEGEGDKIQNLATLSNLGYLIPVTCGHNGNLNKIEKALFDYYLKNSGFLDIKN